MTAESPFRKQMVVSAAFLMAAATACGGLGADETAAPDQPSVSPSPAPTGAVSYRGLPVADLAIAKQDQVKIKMVVDIAETDQARQTGLMKVPRMADDYGMAFLFKGPVQVGFHMKDTLIPLDIAFWDESMKIVDTFEMPPCKKQPCPVFLPKSSYVGAVEMNSGLLQENGAGNGDQVTLTRRVPADP